MRAVVQRVKRASVTVENNVVAKIGPGLVILLGVGRDDEKKDACYLAEKIINLRIFDDQAGKMNLSLQDTRGEILAVSQFTLFGDARKGRRPGYSDAAEPVKANEMYLYFVEEIKRQGIPVQTGIFQAHMQVELINDGPVTIMLDSQKLF